MTSLDSDTVCLGALAPTALENSGQGEAAVGMTLCGGGRRSLSGVLGEGNEGKESERESEDLPVRGCWDEGGTGWQGEGWRNVLARNAHSLRAAADDQGG